MRDRCGTVGGVLRHTGEPGGIAFAMVFFGALYGAPALLARELARRRGWGWPSLLLLFAALGTAQACLIDQSLFSADYQGYEGWEQTRAATLLPALGVSGVNAFNFIIGHVIFSFGAPIALAEAWVPRRARTPWLGRIGLVVAAIAYLGAAAMIATDPESHAGTLPQLLIAALVVIAFVVAAVLLGQRHAGQTAPEPAGRSERRLPIGAPLAVALVLAFIPDLAGETWAGLALSITATAVLGITILLASRRWQWTIRHTAAVGLAFLLIRGILAFTYYPLLGDVSAGPKYAHNTLMLLTVLAAGWLALRPRNDEIGHHTPHPDPATEMNHNP